MLTHLRSFGLPHPVLQPPKTELTAAEAFEQQCKAGK